MSIAHDLRDVIKQKITEKMASKGDQIVKGTATSYEAYKHEAGKIAGLREARELVDDCFKNLLDEEADGS